MMYEVNRCFFLCVCWLVPWLYSGRCLRLECSRLTCQQSCHKVTLDREERDSESEEQRENAPGSDEKTGGERSYACASLSEVGERHVKTVFWNRGLRLCKGTWANPGGSSWQYLCVYLWAWARDGEREIRERENERPYVHIEVGLAEWPSMIQLHLSSPIRPLWPHTHKHTVISRWQVSLW